MSQRVPESEKKKRRNISLSDFEVSELILLSPRRELSDGIRVALHEASLLREQRKLLFEAKLRKVGQ